MKKSWEDHGNRKRVLSLLVDTQEAVKQQFPMFGASCSFKISKEVCSKCTILGLTHDSLDHGPGAVLGKSSHWSIRPREIQKKIHSRCASVVWHSGEVSHTMFNILIGVRKLPLDVHLTIICQLYLLEALPKQPLISTLETTQDSRHVCPGLLQAQFS